MKTPQRHPYLRSGAERRRAATAATVTLALGLLAATAGLHAQSGTLTQRATVQQFRLQDGGGHGPAIAVTGSVAHPYAVERHRGNPEQTIARSWTRAGPSSFDPDVFINTAVGGAPGAQVRTEKVTFLGVSTNGVNPVVSSQLGLPRGFFLTVAYTAPDSPAAAAGLKPNDILKRFDDQLLINPEQLRVLVRSKKAGEKIKIAFLRGGDEQVAEVELTTHDVPVTSTNSSPWFFNQGVGGGPIQNFHFNTPAGGGDIADPNSATPPAAGGGASGGPAPGEGGLNSIESLVEEFRQSGVGNEDALEQIQRLTQQLENNINERRKSILDLRQRSKGNPGELADQMRELMDQFRLRQSELQRQLELHLKGLDEEVEALELNHQGPGGNFSRTTVIGSSQSTLSTGDNEGNATLSQQGEHKHLKVTDAKGEVIYDGPVNTEEEREKLPDAARRRLEQLESNRRPHIDLNQGFQRGEIKPLPGSGTKKEPTGIEI